MVDEVSLILLLVHPGTIIKSIDSWITASYCFCVHIDDINHLCMHTEFDLYAFF